MISKLRFEAIACAFVSVPSDSDEQSCLRSALTLIFKLLAPMIFERCGTSAVAELVRGSWSNQEPLSLSARILFFSWSAYFLLWAPFIVYPSPRTYFCFWFFDERNVNALRFYVKILSSARCIQNMQITWNCRENYSQGTRSVTRLWHFPNLLTFIWKYVFLNKWDGFLYF